MSDATTNKLLGKQWKLGAGTALSPCGLAFSMQESANNIAGHIVKCSTCDAASTLVNAYNKICSALAPSERAEFVNWAENIPWSGQDLEAKR